MRQIFVDSRDRSSGTSTDFSMALPQTLSLSSGHQGRIDDLRLPNAIPTISIANNKIDVLMNGRYDYLTLTNGQCNTGDQLADRIRTKLLEVAGGWNVTYDASQMTLEITCNNDFTFTGGTFMQQLLNRPYSRANNRHYLFLYVPLQGLDICYLCCSNFSHADNVGPKHSSDVLCSIPFTVGYGAVQHYSMSNSVFFDLPAVTLQQLSFQLRDRDYNIVNSFANISFTLTID
jgi:hypothetical protein